MSKVCTILDLNEKLNIIAFANTNTVLANLITILKAIFIEKTKVSVFENDRLYVVYKTRKYEYICHYETQTIKEICELFYLLGHIEKNALREVIVFRYVSICVENIYKLVDNCVT
ncbi:hypothetical protein CDIK_1087 [Cucumispora dikerogammari]|nr:hypothetical protein CDIK_1087 [Cucumispora dikerogammari]